MDNVFQNRVIAGPATMHVNLERLVESIEKSVNRNVSLLENFTVEEGWLGACLFYCYYAKFTGEDQHYDKAEGYLDKALNLVDYQYYKKKYPTDSYDFNLSGMGKFFIKAVDNGFLDMDICPYLEKIDDVLYDLCRNKIRHGDFSLFSGALATGHYLLLNGCMSAKNEKLIIEIIEGIEKHAIRSDNGGICWQNPKLKNRIYLGLTHGSAMIISFLSACYEKGISKDKCAFLIEEGLTFVLGCKRKDPRHLFPVFLGHVSEKSQFSLCYGDLGMGYGLLRGATVIKNQEIRRDAIDVLDACLDRKFEDLLTFDASITYGASGLAYLFEKIYRMEPHGGKYLKARDYWIRQISKYAMANNEFCGFESHIGRYSNSFNLSYSWGITGIGITLMKYLKKDLPTLDSFNYAV